MKFIIGVLSLVTFCNLVAGQKFASKPQMQADLDILGRLHVWFNETKDEDQIRLSKTYFRADLENPFLGMKLTLLEQSKFEKLLPCDSLDLIAPENLELLDCQLPPRHIVDRRYPEVHDTKYEENLYVRRSSIRIKTNTPLPNSMKQRRDLYLYPLKRQVIKENISTTLHDFNLTDTALGPTNLSLGYYFEGNLDPKGDNPVICSGKVFLSVNRTEVLTRLHSDPFPEDHDELQFLIQQAKANGYFFSLQDVDCPLPVSGLLPVRFSLNIDFAIVRRLEFPYLLVRNSVSTSPWKQILYYDAILSQHQDPYTNDPHSYNMTIDWKASSFYKPIFNFKLDQKFVFNDEHTGWENMVFSHPNLPIIVDAFWNATNFVKSGRFYYPEVGRDVSQTLEEDKHAFNIMYLDDKSKDHATLSIDIRRDFLAYFGLPLEVFSNAMQAPLKDVDHSRSHHYEPPREEL